MYFCKKSKLAVKGAISLHTHGVDLCTQIKFHTAEEHLFLEVFDNILPDPKEKQFILIW